MICGRRGSFRFLNVCKMCFKYLKTGLGEQVFWELSVLYIQVRMYRLEEGYL